MSTARNLVVAIALLCFAGCATTRTLETLTPEGIQRRVEPGDVVHVDVRDGRGFEIRVDKVEADALTGTTIENRRFRIPYSAIEALQIREGRTGAAVGAGALAIVGPIVVIALIVGFGEEVLDAFTDPNGDD